MRKESEFFDIIEENVKMMMTAEDREVFEAAAYCSECNGKFGPSDIKVRDHDHHTGEFRSALCNFCNLQKKNLLFINLYCHNMSGFDSHLLIKALDMESTQFSILSNFTPPGDGRAWFSLGFGSFTAQGSACCGPHQSLAGSRQSKAGRILIR